MKHNLQVTLILVGFFLMAQIIGLAITSQALPVETLDEETGEIVLVEQPVAPGLERPEFDNEKPWQLLIFLSIAILIGTSLVLVLAKYKAFRTWKVWFFMATTLCLYIAFYTIFKKFLGSELTSPIIALTLAGVLGFLKIYRQNIISHNLTELFIYAGLAVIFVPIDVFTLPIAVGLLLLISVYDMIAVWQSKHMVKMAKFQTEAKLFAGLSIPYKLTSEGENKVKKVHAVNKSSKPTGTANKTRAGNMKSAILGGGDIGFPLLFTGVLMKSVGFTKVLIVPVIVTFALFLLMYFAKKDRFYPAMPFITAGCFGGYGLMWLIF